ncbi:NYN domain-containing protein [Pannus brasiliensis CCIBt3594]|uniref:NYN domain-containing protein n=1 Tax=Pannus brasiliensis CCIBt3594 TaxID=1427578 RepID=A0AAW9QN37_9CHRO
MTTDLPSIPDWEFSRRSIASTIYQCLLSVYRHYPRWMSEKLKNQPWEKEEFRERFIAWSIEKIGMPTGTNETVNRLLPMLTSGLESEFFTSPYYVRLITSVHEILQYPFLNYSSMILLDAENLFLEEKLERFVAETSPYPIRGKYAFANWRGLGKKDLDFHQRGYHLIHVPPDKNNTDLKMTSFGLSIAIQYPRIKEVFVCSSDRDLDHLANSLLSHGLKVYRVFRRDNDLVVSDGNSSSDRKYSLVTAESVLSLEDSISSLKEIVQKEREDSNSFWMPLARLSAVFREKHGITLSQVISRHLPGKRARDIFLDRKQDFVIHQVSEESEIYISLFDFAPAESTEALPSVSRFSKQDCEDFIRGFIEETTRKNPTKPSTVADIASKFYQTHAIQLKQVTEQLGLGKHLPKALKNFERLEITKIGNTYQVSCREDSGSSDPIISTKEQFLEIVDRLTRELLEKSDRPSINIGNVGAYFREQYNVPVTKMMSQLGMGKNLTKAFQSIDGLQLTKVDNNYFVGLRENPS